MATRLEQLARFVTAQTGLACDVRQGVDSRGDPWYLLAPAGASADHAFAVRVTIRWRRIVAVFEPGKFAGDLLAAMGSADAAGRRAFRTVLEECSNRGGDVKFQVNETPCDPQREETWPAHWSRLLLILNSRIDPETEEDDPGFGDALQWAQLFVAAIVALLPIQSKDAEEDTAPVGYAEGGAASQQSIRYERDRRNRAAAIAIWGCKCQACGLDFGDTYGDVAEGFIEVHHTTPVSELEPGTIIDPTEDLVPLCPNCHAVAHRRDPPFTVTEIRELLESGG